MGAGRMLSWQPTLPVAADGGDLSFARLVRHHLDARSWVDHVPGWLPDHDALFDDLLATAPWHQRQRWMYDRLVDEPRLVAGWPDGELPSRLEQVRAVLSARYGVRFDSVHVNLYRDGTDSVAWHGDTVRRTMTDPLVATVSLGGRRRFLLRPGASGPARLGLDPGEGDLLVMGGACQHEWQHTVPKDRAGGARMSVTLRHSPPGGRSG